MHRRKQAWKGKKRLMGEGAAPAAVSQQERFE